MVKLHLVDGPRRSRGDHATHINPNARKFHTNLQHWLNAYFASSTQLRECSKGSNRIIASFRTLKLHSTKRKLYKITQDESIPSRVVLTPIEMIKAEKTYICSSISNASFCCSASVHKDLSSSRRQCKSCLHATKFSLTAWIFSRLVPMCADT